MLHFVFVSLLAFDFVDGPMNGAVNSEGRRLFEKETFGGNGRTCSTCHLKDTGTITPAEIQKAFQKNPNDPLFKHDGSDNGLGQGTSRIRQDATILVDIPLPANVYLTANPAARKVRLRHGVPSTLDTPALDPVLMYDGRAANLVEQAHGAVLDHTQNTVQPTQQQLSLIAEFQKTNQFFSDSTLRKFADGTGAAPQLPEGKTAAEKRGRRFFIDGPLNLADGTGFCAVCHSGPMLNEVNDFNPIPVPPFKVAKGTRFQSILSAELLPNGDPLQTFAITNPNGTVDQVTISDPGRALQTGDFRGFPFGNLGQFKIPTLWNVKNTAPYFHNNAAKSLEEVLQHYRTFFLIAIPGAIPGAQPFDIGPQDQADIVAFLKLL